MNKKNEYEKLIEQARLRFRNVQHQSGDFRGGAYISEDGKKLVINRALPIDERIELVRKILNTNRINNQ